MYTYDQWFFFSRIIGYLTLKIIYFHYVKKHILDQSIQYIFYLILKKDALHTIHAIHANGVYVRRILVFAEPRAGSNFVGRNCIRDLKV